MASPWEILKRAALIRQSPLPQEPILFPKVFSRESIFCRFTFLFTLGKSELGAVRAPPLSK